MQGMSKSTAIKPFQPCFIHFDIFSFSAQQTIIVEMNVVWQRLVVSREVGSIVFEELPLHPIFVLLFLPPDRKHDDEENKSQNMYSRELKLLLSAFP